METDIHTHQKSITKLTETRTEQVQFGLEPGVLATNSDLVFSRGFGEDTTIKVGGTRRLGKFESRLFIGPARKRGLGGVKSLERG